MNKQEIIERLNNKLSETLELQQLFEPLKEGYMKCESKAIAYMTAINYVEQLDEPQKVKVPAYVAEYIEAHRKWGPEIFIADWLADNDAVDKWLYNNSEKENNRRFLIAVKAFVEGYEVEEADKWMVKSNQLYFTGVTQLIAHDPLTYNFVKDQKHAHIFDDKKSAEKEASYFNGTVEKVEE